MSADGTRIFQLSERPSPTPSEPCVHSLSLPEVETLIVPPTGFNSVGLRDEAHHPEIRWLLDDREPQEHSRPRLVVEVYRQGELIAKYANTFVPVSTEDGHSLGGPGYVFGVDDDVSRKAQVAFRASDGTFGTLFPKYLSHRLFELIAAGAYLRFVDGPEADVPPVPCELVLPPGFVTPTYEPPPDNPF